MAFKVLQKKPMLLDASKKAPKPIVKKEEPKKTPAPKAAPNKGKTKETLPTDDYKDEIQPIIIPFDDKRHIVISVKRGGELGLPQLDIRWFQTTSVFTGFTRKGISIPLAHLHDLQRSIANAVEQALLLVDEQTPDLQAEGYDPENDAEDEE